MGRDSGRRAILRVRPGHTSMSLRETRKRYTGTTGRPGPFSMFSFLLDLDVLSGLAFDREGELYWATLGRAKCAVRHHDGDLRGFYSGWRTALGPVELDSDRRHFDATSVGASGFFNLTPSPRVSLATCVNRTRRNSGQRIPAWKVRRTVCDAPPGNKGRGRH